MRAGKEKSKNRNEGGGEGVCPPRVSLLRTTPKKGGRKVEEMKGNQASEA